VEAQHETAGLTYQPHVVQLGLAGDDVCLDLDGGWIVEDDEQRMPLHEVRAICVRASVTKVLENTHVALTLCSNVCARPVLLMSKGVMRCASDNDWRFHSSMSLCRRVVAA
jgi:hypothetical protein